MYDYGIKIENNITNFLSIFGKAGG